MQAAGKLPVDIAALGVDALTLSAHKLGGPKGAGALVLASDRIEIADRLIRGGGQERGYRAGTENVAAIAGFGAAAEHRRLDAGAGSRRGSRRCATRPRRELAGLRRTRSSSAAELERLPNTFAFAVPGLKAETALIAFDLAGHRRVVGLGLLVRQGQARRMCSTPWGSIRPWPRAPCA